MKTSMHLKNQYLRYHNRSLFLVDTFYNIFFIMFLIPFANHTLELIMKLSRVSYITQENVLALLTTPHALLLLALLLFVILLFLQTKLASLLYYCSTEGHTQRPSLSRLIHFGLFKTLFDLRFGRLAPLLFTLPFYIFVNLPVLLGITFLADIEFTSGTDDELILKIFILIALILVSFISFRGIFALHYYMNEHISFTKALQYSKELLKGRGNRTFRILLISHTLFTLGFFAFYYGLLLLTALGAYLFADKSIVITVFLSAYPRINLYATLLFSMITFVFHINLTTSLFHTYQQEALQDILPDYPDSEYHFTYQSKKQRIIINGLILTLLIAGVFNLYYSIYHDSYYLGDILTGVTISSHRGNSHIAPENTIPALESAIIAGSDYAEIDVQQNKDGTLILLHDKSLQRTAGVNEFIWELTDEQLNGLDVGSWFSLDYLNTRIPTLEEVFIHCKDRIKLNIEIKITGNEQALEERLVALIEEYDYENQCIISSTNHNALRKVKGLNEDLHTGLILSAVYGNFFDKEYVDFFSIRYNFISKDIVTSAHRAGKEVHAWTVNTMRELERMKSLKVDSIITDNPSLSREILYRDDTNDTFLQLIRRMLKNRSYYRLSQALD
ncbi:MAG: glycerophosphoryl diester phosphodiesterase [Herbinix sp.]|nr:glycerophosphoryl diester phosphodiesterase [Herbinix sp.]